MIIDITYSRVKTPLLNRVQNTWLQRINLRAPVNYLGGMSRPPESERERVVCSGSVDVYN